MLDVVKAQGPEDAPQHGLGAVAAQPHGSEVRGDAGMDPVIPTRTKVVPKGVLRSGAGYRCSQDGPCSLARRTARSAPLCHGAPWPGRTWVAAVSAIASREVSAIELSAVAAPAMILGPVRPV